MDEFETGLRDMLRAKAAHLDDQVAGPPPDLAARAANRRRGTMAKATALVLAVVVAGVALPRVLTDGDRTGGHRRASGPAIAAEEGQPCAPRTISGARPVAPTREWRRVELAGRPDCFRLIATQRGSAGVAADTAFVLDADVALDASDIAKRLSVEPEIALGVEAETPTRVRIEPRSRLQDDTIYRFTLRRQPQGDPLDRWTFQTEGTLRVVQTLPADEATGVPTDVGIELTFSHEGVEGASERLRVEPAVEGRTERHGRTVVFVPKKLLPGTVYTVTLAPGSAIPGSGGLSIAGPTVFRFETGTDKRGEQALRPLFSRGAWESPTGKAPALGIMGLEGPAAMATLPLTIHRFASPDAFLASLEKAAQIPAWAFLARSDYVATTDGLPVAAKVDAVIRDGRGERYAILPDPLPAGYYLVRAEFEGRPTQTWLQVTDLATYVSVSAARTLVWVNDLAAGGPSPGALVRVAGTEGNLARTGADGIALVPTPASLLTLVDDGLGQRVSRAGNLLVSDGARTAVVPLADMLVGSTSFEFRENTFGGDPGLYWRMLQLDRTLYRPNDTVRFFGLARRRDGPPKEETVGIDITTTDEEGRSTKTASVTATTTVAGTFLGSAPLLGASPGYYTVEARVGGTVVAAQSFQVEDFVRPAYRVDVVPSRRAVFAGETVGYTATASFFEGTAVPGVKLTLTGDGEDQGQSLTTGADGLATVQRAVAAGGTSPTLRTVNIRPETPEEGEITASASVAVFPAAVDLEVGTERIGTDGVIRGTAFLVDPGRADRAPAEDPFSVARQGPALGQRLSAEVVEISYRTVEDGEEYDFIAKIVRPRFRYEQVRRPPVRIDGVAGADGRFELRYAAAPDRSYEITLAAKDGAGRTVEEKRFDAGNAGDTDTPSHLEVVGPGQFKLNDPVRVRMALARNPAPSPADRFLFIEAQSGIRRYALSSEPAYVFTFSADHVPGVHVAGVRFTGASYEPAAGPTLVPFDPAEKKLRVEVRPDKERYRPREAAKVEIRVTDAGGRPVVAEVVVSGVDEKVFAAQGFQHENTEPVDELYAPVASGVLSVYASHQRYTSGSSAEAGEGGSERRDFPDTVVFERVTTATDGRASVSLQLPDNLTNFRVTAVAFTRELQAGRGTGPIVVGLPLFAEVAMATSYLVADRPVIGLRAFGDALTPGDPVSFTVESPTLLDQPLTAKGSAFEPVAVPLPALRAGRHDLTVRVAGAGRTDAVVRPVEVVDSRLVRTETRHSEVAAGEAWAPRAALSAGDKPVTVVIADHNRGRWYDDLIELANTSGDRVDQALARDVASQLLSEWFDAGPPPPASFRAAPYQTKGGGIAILPFAGADLALTARVAILAPERFGRTGLARFLHQVLDDPDESRERATIALAGLAGLGEPVLEQVGRATQASDLTWRERAYLATAAASLGDLDRAEPLYRGLLNEFGEIRGTTLRLNVGGNQDDVREATGLTAAVGAVLSNSLAPAMAEYVPASRAGDRLVELDRLAFLAAVLPNLAPEPVKASFVVGGRRETVVLERGQVHALRLSADDLSRLDLRAEAGRIGVSQSAVVPLDLKSVRVDPDLAVQRILPATVAANDLVQIKLTVRIGNKAASGCYRVTDLLPSGLAAVSQPYRFGQETGDLSVPYSVVGPRVSFCAGPRPITYLARVVSTGTYVAEAPVVQAVGAPESIAVGAPATVRVG